MATGDKHRPRQQQQQFTLEDKRLLQLRHNSVVAQDQSHRGLSAIRTGKATTNDACYLLCNEDTSFRRLLSNNHMIAEQVTGCRANTNAEINHNGGDNVGELLRLTNLKLNDEDIDYYLDNAKLRSSQVQLESSSLKKSTRLIIPLASGVVEIGNRPQAYRKMLMDGGRDQDRQQQRGQQHDTVVLLTGDNVGDRLTCAAAGQLETNSSASHLRLHHNNHHQHHHHYHQLAQSFDESYYTNGADVRLHDNHNHQDPHQQQQQQHHHHHHLSHINNIDGCNNNSLQHQHQQTTYYSSSTDGFPQANVYTTLVDDLVVFGHEHEEFVDGHQTEVVLEAAVEQGDDDQQQQQEQQQQQQPPPPLEFLELDSRPKPQDSFCSEPDGNLRLFTCRSYLDQANSSNDDQPIVCPIDTIVLPESVISINELRSGEQESNDDQVVQKQYSSNSEGAFSNSSNCVFSLSTEVEQQQNEDYRSGSSNSSASDRRIKSKRSNGTGSGPTEPSNDITLSSSSVVDLNEFRVCEWEGCENTFEDMQQFVKHLEEKHVNQNPKEKNRYFCLWSNCKRNEQEFNARYKLLIHMRVHSGEKPYPCCNGNCKKSFSRLENLKIHQRSHTGEKPYKCSYENCLKSFTNSSDRIKHHKTHKDPRPYCCSQEGCSKRYTDPSSLRKHLRAHKRQVQTSPVNANATFHLLPANPNLGSPPTALIQQDQVSIIRCAHDAAATAKAEPTTLIEASYDPCSMFYEHDQQQQQQQEQDCEDEYLSELRPEAQSYDQLQSYSNHHHDAKDSKLQQQQLHSSMAAQKHLHNLSAFSNHQQFSRSWCAGVGPGTRSRPQYYLGGTMTPQVQHSRQEAYLSRPPTALMRVGGGETDRTSNFGTTTRQNHIIFSSDAQMEDHHRQQYDHRATHQWQTREAQHQSLMRSLPAVQRPFREPYGFSSSPSGSGQNDAHWLSGLNRYEPHS